MLLLTSVLCCCYCYCCRCFVQKIENKRHKWKRNWKLASAEKEDENIASKHSQRIVQNMKMKLFLCYSDRICSKLCSVISSQSAINLQLIYLCNINSKIREQPIVSSCLLNNILKQCIWIFIYYSSHPHELFEKKDCHRQCKLQLSYK